MAKYDVGIYGLWFGNNYGSMITYYALSQVIEKLGYTYAMISNPLESKVDYDSLGRSDPLRFANERYNITPFLPLDRMGELNEMFDTFIMGSDQMWNYFLSRPFKQTYFLDFADDTKKKISYATSFGSIVYRGPGHERKITQKNLGRFDAISVRDDFSVDICREKFNVDAVQVLDPVFLCPMKGYQKLIDEVGTMENVNGDYIFAYILDPNAAIGRSLQEISKQTGKKVIVVFNQVGNMAALRDSLEIKSGDVQFIFDVNVKEWLYLFNNAGLVLTDSFHGTCFSVIFRKPFISMRNNFRGGKRFTYLLEGLGLADHLIDKPEGFVTKFNELGIDHKIDYDRVEELARPEKERCLSWLKGALDGSVKTNKHPCMPEHLFEKGKTPAPPYSWASVEAADITCVGCGMCASVCPNDAITITTDEYGFFKPDVDNTKCIGCGKCTAMCTDRTVKYNNTETPECYTVPTDISIQRKNTTGGIFSCAARYIIDNGGYFCGPVYEKDMKVKHIISNDPKELNRFCVRGFLQSDTSGIYPQIEELLDKGEKLLFLGTPCEVAALYSYLGGSREGLVTMDRICHGVTSHKIFEKYTKDQNITDITGMTFEDELFFGAYINGIIKCDSCCKCKYDRVPRQADITAGMFPQGKYGGAAVIVNNSKGRELFEGFSKTLPEPKRMSFNKAKETNHTIVRPDGIHKNRSYFFKYFNDIDFASLAEGCLNNHLYRAEIKALSEKVPEDIHDIYYAARLTAQMSRGRKIVTWSHSEIFNKVLFDNFGEKVEFSVTSNKDEVNGSTVRYITELIGKRDDYFVSVITPSFVREYKMMLEKYGYREGFDYTFRIHPPIVIENFDCSKGRYEDSYGNTIEGYGAVIRRVVFRGCNSHIALGREVNGAHNLTIDFTSNVRMEIGRRTRITGATVITSGYVSNIKEGGTLIMIGDECRVTDGLIRMFVHPNISELRVGNRTSFENALGIHINTGKKLIIGNDCMISYDVEMWAGDGHTLFDTETGCNTNSDPAGQPDHRSRLVLGDHVWVAKGAFIMHGTDIGRGSVVGARSVVKGRFPNNCAIAGNPAHIVKKNVAWARDNGVMDISMCGTGNAELTQE